MHRSQNKYSKMMNIFLGVYITKRRRSAATLRVFEEKRQVIGYTYLKNVATVLYNKIL